MEALDVRALVWMASLLCSLVCGSARAALDGDFPEPGMVTLVDFGAETCLPCKAMAPILKKLDVAYEGRAAVRFVSTVKHPETARRYRVSVIPTQIVFDHRGKIVGWHTGFMDEQGLRAKLDELIEAAKRDQASGAAP